VARTRSPERRQEYEEQLACPPLPDALVYLWLVFIRLRRRKGSNGFALSPIEWSDIDAFIRLSSTRLAPWEIAVIEDLDDIFIAAQAKRPGNGS
jgi:hypothetical protein